MVFDSKIQGIPCQIDVTYATKREPATYYEPECGGDFEYTVLTTKGKPASWLQSKVTDMDDVRIYEEYLAIIEDC